MQLCQFVVSRAHTTFAEVAESVKTFQEPIVVDIVLYVFKNITFRDVGCTLSKINLWIALHYVPS